MFPAFVGGFFITEPPGTELWQLKVWGLPCGSDGKESTCNAGDLSSIPGLGRSPGGGLGNPLLGCLKNRHGQRSLASYSTRGHKELDTTD